MLKGNESTTSSARSKVIKVAVVASLAIATVGIASGCSSSNPAPTKSASSSPSSAVPTPVREPIMISKAGDVTAVVGDVLDVVTKDVLNVVTDNPAVLQVTQPVATPATPGGATFNASATVIGVGTAKLTVTTGLPGATPYVVNVTAVSSSASPSVSGSPSVTASPVRAPIIITKAETIAVTIGDVLDVTTPSATITTDNAAVLKVKQPSTTGGTAFNGGADVVGTGKATMTVTSSAFGAPTYTVTVTSTGVAVP